MDKTFKRFVVDVSVAASISTSFGLFTIYIVAYTQHVYVDVQCHQIYFCVCECKSVRVSQWIESFLFVSAVFYTLTHRPATHGQRQCSMLNCILVVYYVCCRHACGYICCRC